MNDKERKYYCNKYKHVNLYFAHGRGWDPLTLTAAIELDSKWPNWMPFWLKRFNNRLLFAHKGRSIVKVTKFYHSLLRKLVPFITDYPRFLQIKEKYGSLRLYGCGKIGNTMEELSYSVCEECGTTSNIGTTKGWIKTICKQCAIDNNRIDNWTLNNHKYVT